MTDLIRVNNLGEGYVMPPRMVMIIGNLLLVGSGEVIIKYMYLPTIICLSENAG